MDLSIVKKLVKLLAESDVDEIEIEEEGKKIRIAKHPTHGPALPMTMAVHPEASRPVLPGSVATPAPLPAAGAPPAPQAAPPVEQNLHEIRSPIVGTFYRAPAPDAAPFVQVGSSVDAGSVLCIIEAMKLMNEIESDVSGRVAKILVENAQPVEYGQVLFLVEKA
jgi:acetyl-CoA carboxylase biotin carboxyl carrier protein